MPGTAEVLTLTRGSIIATARVVFSSFDEKLYSDQWVMLLDHPEKIWNFGVFNKSVVGAGVSGALESVVTSGLQFSGSIIGFSPPMVRAV
jgi:hypothetical protein